MTLRQYLNLPENQSNTLEFEGFWYYTNGKDEVILDRSDKQSKSLKIEFVDDLPLSIQFKLPLKYKDGKPDRYQFSIYNEHKEPLYLEEYPGIKSKSKIVLEWGKNPQIETYAQGEPLYKMGSQERRFFSFKSIPLTNKVFLHPVKSESVTRLYPTMKPKK